MHKSVNLPEIQTKMISQFADLDDEIGADDWTISIDEINIRKLIKQTPRYNVYKADWFGDVTVYEPIVRRSTQYGTKFSQKFSCSSNSKSCSNDSHSETDSAYSSISSSPQYYTKQDHKREFEFPVQGLLDELQVVNQQQEVHSESDLNEPRSTCMTQKGSPTSSPVVLNKDSFLFGADGYQSEDCDYEACFSGRKSSMTTSDSGAPPPTSCDWFELNELRLVAHENFILFMGAIENPTRAMDDCFEQTASLVMQTSHPKSVSLHDLLHANKTTSASHPLYHTNRFFAPGHCRQHQMSVTTKLNICQQVTDAMTYLHDKNIVHGRLTSANVYIEPNERVKISLIDTEEREIGVGADFVADQGCCEHATAANSAQVESAKDLAVRRQTSVATFNLSTLTYLSPELIRTIRVAEAEAEGDDAKPQRKSQVQMDLSLLTKEADVFSFGTLLFELFEERFPFSEATQSVDSPSIKLAKSDLVESTKLGTTRLFHSLCLDSPATPKPAYSPAKLNFAALNFNTTQSNQPDREVKAYKTSNGNIKTSASELIYQIGSGQIEQKNVFVKNSKQSPYPALVKRIISACWKCKPSERPTFKQLHFAYS